MFAIIVMGSTMATEALAKPAKADRATLKARSEFMKGCNPKSAHWIGEACKCYIYGVETVMPIQKLNQFNKRLEGSKVTVEQAQVFYRKLSPMYGPYKNCIVGKN